MVNLHGLWKSFDTLVAIRDLNLEVEKGQTWGLIGPNGAGKTTLLRMISTLSKPERGTLRVCGLDALENPREVRRRLALMPAEFGFPLDMTILEYMDYFACACGIPRRERPRVIAEVLELTDLKGRGEVIIRGLSTGNRQRLLLAKTLLSNPELLLLDEPASGLDPRARTEVQALLKELSAMGKTILISSHILADIGEICTHVCILETGTKVLAGPISELRKRKASAHRVIRLTLPVALLDQAAGLIARLPDIVHWVRTGDELEVATAQQNCNFILQALIEAGIEIQGMREDRPDLEEIFMNSTRGVVS